jgi:uncharacterized protein YndB with AHSA1/START domain
MPGTPSGTSVVDHEVRVAAEPETVFGFFTDPAKMTQWMGAEAVLDPRPGGICRIAFHAPDPVVELMVASYADGPPPARGADGVAVVLGEFVEVEPFRRIVFTWGFEQELFAVPPQSTAVEVTLTPDGEGTILGLTHRRLPSAAVGFHRAGWEHYLPRLATAAAGDDPGLDSWQVPPSG